jgi:hypothetical protein
MRRVVGTTLALSLSLLTFVVAPTAKGAGSEIKFAPSVVVDPFRMGGEPMMATDSKGNIYITSIIGFSNHTSFLWKSEDGGESFDLLRVPIPAIQRPNTTVGGGDTAIVIGPPAPGKTEETIAYIDLEGLVTFGAGFSFDGGNTFENNQLFASGDRPFGDRQWVAWWRDPTGLDHYYNFFNGLTSYAIVETTDYGASWHDWSRNVTNTPGASRPGPVFVDQKTGELLLTWTWADGGTDEGGAGFTRCDQQKVCKDVMIAKQPNANTNNTFAAGARDRQGNIYVTWSAIPIENGDTLPTLVYMSVSTDKGDHWSKPVVVSKNVPVASMPTIVAGDAGRVGIAYYGTKQQADPNNNDGPWFPYLAMSTNALASSPSWQFSQISEHTNHINPICTAGTICAADPNRMNDRNLIDFFWTSIGKRGEVLVTWNDTAHQVGAQPPKSSPFTMFAKQIAGPSLYADVGTLNPPASSVMAYSGRAAAVGSSLPVNWRGDASGDAPVPRHSATGPGKTIPSLDARALWIEPKGSDAMRVAMTIADTSGTVPAGSAYDFYMVWWWADHEVHYAAAEVSSSGIVDCYAGEPSISHPQSPRWAIYQRLAVPPPSVTTIECALDANTKQITFDVPYAAVNGKPGQRLFSVTGGTYHLPTEVGGALNAVALLPEEVDQTSPFSYVLGSQRVQVANFGVTAPQPAPPAAAPKPRPASGGAPLPNTGTSLPSPLIVLALFAASILSWSLRRSAG